MQCWLQTIQLWEEPITQKHLDECIWNPTIGGIAEQQYVLKSQNRFHKLNPRMKYLIDILDNTKNRLYPKTRKARDYIIKR